MVKLLTKDPKEGYYDRLLKHGNPKTWIIKGCDRLSNLRTLKDTSPDFQAKQYAETRKVIYPLLDHLVSVSTAQNEHVTASATLRRLIHQSIEG
jgi:(p)ppGpp synthase/HD superfamily hydrolase